MPCYHDGVSDVYALVRSLRADTWSRNRHFEAHATPSGAEARRLFRFLRGLERDIAGADEVVVRRQGAKYVVRLRFTAVRLDRIVTLPRPEYELLLENDAIAERLTLRDE